MMTTRHRNEYGDCYSDWSFPLLKVGNGKIERVYSFEGGDCRTVSLRCLQSYTRNVCRMAWNRWRN